MDDTGLNFTQEEIQLMLDNLDAYTPEEQAEIEKIADVLTARQHAKACHDDLIAFCKHMQPDYTVGKHHRVLADLLMDIATGSKDRICVNMPPRHGKSQLVSIYFPAWFMGKYPNKKVLMVSHTTDLAVDFGRKVRNLIDSAAYSEVFPGVKLASDSKSAGRWNTSLGGEYFACIRRTALVSTQRGYIPAGQVRIGDTLCNSDSGVTVQEIYDSQHPATYTVAGLECSDKHPIWTMNRGWVYASDLVPTDILTTESILDRMKVLLRRIYGYLEHTYVSALVQHKVSLHQPQQREMGKLRGAGCYVMRTVARVREFFTGHGAATNTSTYCGEGGQQRPLQPGELPMGRRVAAAEQQAHQQGFGWAYVGATCTGYGYDTGSHSVPQQQRDTVGGAKTTEEELRAYGSPKNIGWLRRTTAYILTRSSQKFKQSEGSAKGYMARIGKTTQNLCGVLLGVRRVGGIKVTQHDTPKHFVNFLTDGNHTFFADGVLTHNCGVGSALAGRGADLLLVDDPHNEQDIINGNFEVFEKAYEWFTYGARTRLMPGGRVAIVQTRWHQDDLTGRVTRDMAQNELSDQYEVVEFPAILEVKRAVDGAETVVEKPLWPEFFDLPALYRTKASMPVFQWNAQYQQNPTSEEASIVKREWWNTWEKDDPPKCEYLIMTLDAAAESHNRADFTALTTWGVFFNEEREGPGANTYNIILLNSIKKRVEFPELKELATEQYREWEPDSFIVEKKSSGTALYQELRRTGIPVGEYTPHRGSGDKMARLNSVADIVRSRLVWVPQTRWAEELVEEVAGFPFMANDDLVDTMVMALMRFRQGGFIRLPSDEPDEIKYFKSRRHGGYY